MVLPKARDHQTCNVTKTGIMVKAHQSKRALKIKQILLKYYSLKVLGLRDT